VIETNYEYALIYACNDVSDDDDAVCDVSAEFAYVISRRASLPGPLLRRVDYIVRRRLCIDSSRLVFAEHSRTYVVGGCSIVRRFDSPKVTYPASRTSAR